MGKLILQGIIPIENINELWIMLYTETFFLPKLAQQNYILDLQNDLRIHKSIPTILDKSQASSCHESYYRNLAWEEHNKGEMYWKAIKNNMMSIGLWENGMNTEGKLEIPSTTGKVENNWKGKNPKPQRRPILHSDHTVKFRMNRRDVYTSRMEEKHFRTN